MVRPTAYMDELLAHDFSLVYEAIIREIFDSILQSQKNLFGPGIPANYSAIRPI